MHTHLFFRASRRLLARVALPLSLLAASVAGAANVDLADKPLFSTTSVPGNLLLDLSVEYPTANSAAYFSNPAYSSATTYLGYFDAAKCYKYLYNSGTPAASYFTPFSTAASSHNCANSTGDRLWSGNYLNYTSMQGLDIFRWVLTGGNRSVDTSGGSGKTILTRSTHSGQGGSGDAPNKTTASADIANATPIPWGVAVTTRVWGAGIKMWFTASADLSPTTITGTTDYQDSIVGSMVKTQIYALYMNVRVCDSTVSLETNCVLYGNTYKPEGLMQQYSQTLRYGAFGYLNDSNALRDGGVLRARMAYIAPTQPVPGAAAATNPNPEWDVGSGIMATNPVPADATATNTFTGNKTNIANSGVMNYLNKFGYTSNTYKTYDPVSELYYASIRYLKGQSNVASYTDVTTGAPSNATVQTWVDGFPVITDWTSAHTPSYDPIVYSCQKNFILGIGDVNTHRDGNLPGSALTASEPATPSEVTADTTINVKTATDTIGTLEKSTNLTLGSTYAPGDLNTYYIAGMAYDAHVPVIGHGLRTFTDPTTTLTTVSTVSTYWLDVQEYQAYVNNNMYYYATKYGGFTVPKPYASYAYATPLTLDSWYNSTQTQGTNKQPDNYFTARDGQAMKDGLTNAFAKIASENNSANGTALAVPTPNVTTAGAVSYSATYDPSSWTGQLIGSSVTFATDGTPTLNPVWDASALLSAPTVTAATRKIVTCCTNATTSRGLPFTATALAAATLDPRTNYTSFANVPGVTSGPLSVANYIAYLRGDINQEVANGGAYRNRKYRLGDIVNSKPVTVGPPNYPFFDTTNAGYADYKATYGSRKNVVYIGANDGMVHAFDGTLSGATAGSELFGYIPSFVYGTTATAPTTGLASLGNSSFTHHYLVDATAGEFDIDLGKTGGTTAGTPNWRTLVIGGLGKGGQGYYALDATDPTTWTDETTIATKVLWEFTNTNMGYTYGTPTVVKTKKYGWVVIFTSGYTNADGRGYFFFVNPATGLLLETVVTPTGQGSTSSPLDLGQASAYIQDYTDMTADAIYAGDLQGNVWRLDVSASNTLLPYPTPTKIASLTDSSGNAQPITTRPLIEIPTNSNARYVLVGTGKLMADSDIASGRQQTFYAIIDGTSTAGAFYGSPSVPLPTGVTFPITRSQLTGNTNLLTGIGSSPSSVMGWYTDLPVSSTIAQRVNVDPFANQGVVAVIGNLPNGSACDPSGTGTLYGLNFATGQTVLLDTNLTTPVTSVAISGVGTDVAIINVGGELNLYTGGSKGVVAKNPAKLTSSSGVTQINWRDVPGTN